MPSSNIFSIFFTFLRLGLTSFGGPAAHIGYFRHEFVERKKWLDDNQFSQLLALCQFLPGPASSQLGFAIGLTHGGFLGALAAFIGFTLPSVLLLVGFVFALPVLNGEIANSVIHGLKLVAVAVVADAVWGMSKNLCKDTVTKSIMVVALVALLLVASSLAQVLVIVLAGLLGYWLCDSSNKQQNNSLNVSYGKVTAMSCLVLFFILLVLSFVSFSHLYINATADFYQAGSLVFGGGHVVLPLLEQSFVTETGLSQQQFLAGYGATQAVPGPLFTFASYIAAVLHTEVSVSLMVVLGTTAIFLPGFLLLVGVLPFWQQVATTPAAFKVLTGVNAAIVGLLAAALYNPIFNSSVFNGSDMAIVTIGFALLTVWKKPPLLVVTWGVMSVVALSFLS